ncbi:uncharacterized protein RJT21DRAFT_1797 [Scheffersomyces amazonensis]|uniref:uncharacterized protein n=1 Tax=Scheffersomyces amazonensis TaxID=1078765 RepID=UPI00315C6F23
MEQSVVTDIVYSQTIETQEDIRSPLQKLQEVVAHAKSKSQSKIDTSSLPINSSANSSANSNSSSNSTTNSNPNTEDDNIIRLYPEVNYHENNSEITSPIHTSKPMNSAGVYSNQDRESIYSFDSVSTNGRLLDRLDFENEDFLEDEYGLIKRESRSSIHSTTKLLEKLDLENNDSKLRRTTSTTNAYRIPNENNLAAIRGLKSSRSIHTSQPYNSQSKSNVHVKHVPMNLVFQNTNNSVGSFKSDIASIKKVGSASSTSLSAIGGQFQIPTQPLPDFLNSKNGSDSSIKKPDSTSQVEEINKPLEQDQQTVPSSTSTSTGVFRTPSAPIIRPKEKLPTRAGSTTSLDYGSTAPKPSTRRILSEGSESSGSSTSLRSLSQGSQIPENSSPGSRTKLALQLRSLGKHREASYQLQIAANAPFNFPQAMYLYAVALRLGQGVKQNDLHAIKWLCKCIMSHSSHLQTASQSAVSSFMDKLHQSPPQNLISSIIRNLDNTVDRDYYKNGNDPILLGTLFAKLSKVQIAKVITVNKNQTDILALCYYELGNFLMNGYGLEFKDEINGIKCLAKAGSLGHIPSMVLLGEIWSNKTKNHKKDLYQAAAWLRLGEIFGVKSIGNSWIYKDKYLPSKSSPSMTASP